jgi:acyl-CoA reductase-like NAD-dependent aldehyde dehydrogenase
VKAWTPAEVKSALESCRVAQREWANVSFDERRAVLMDVMDWCLEHQDEIMGISVRESGKTVAEAVMGEVLTTCEKIRWIVHNGEDCIGPEERPVPSLLFLKRAWVEYAPLGVIGIIVPWNYPFHNVLSACVAAIFTGNGALCKVSEFASWSAERIEQVFREVLARRGHNPDLVQVVVGYGETGAALVECGVDKVLFIGSPAVGKRVMMSAAKNLTPVILELGGKDPFIVFDDCDFDHMLDVAIRGAFINCGQNCISSERFYVQAGVYDRFVAAVDSKMRCVRQGSSLLDGGTYDFGSMTMAGQVRIVDELVRDAVARGARVVSGGGPRDPYPRSGSGSGSAAAASAGGALSTLEAKESKHGGGPARDHSGYWFAPTVLANVNHDMRIANEEAFGPVMSIIKFNTEDEVVNWSNTKTPYGLGSSIFTTDYHKAHRVATRLVCGMTSVNDFGMVPLVQSLPFGGIKDSGFGCFNGAEGLRGFMRTKSVVSDRFHIRAQTPGFLQYPMAHNAHLIAQQAITMIYTASWLASLRALVKLVWLALKAKKPTPPPVAASTLRAS